MSNTSSTSFFIRYRKPAYIIMGLMALVMVVLSFVQLWVLYTTVDIAAYGIVPSDENGWPAGDKRGAFLMLNEQSSLPYEGNLVELLATTEPGVVDETKGLHLLSSDLKAVLIQTAVVGEPGDYKVYRIGVAEENQMSFARQPGGKVMIIEPKSKTWEPGAYIVETPAEGMFGGGRTYYQFYVDEPEEESGIRGQGSVSN
jgi:hypothetical protein